MGKTLLQIWNEVGHQPFSARGTVDSMDMGRVFEVKRVEFGRAYGYFPSRSGLERYRNAERPYWELVQGQVQNVPRYTSRFTNCPPSVVVVFDEASDLDSKIFETIATKIKSQQGEKHMHVFDYAVLQKDPASPFKPKLIKRDSIVAANEEKAKFAIILGLEAAVQADVENVEILIRPFK